MIARPPALPALLLLALLPAAARGQGCCTPGSSPLGGLSGAIPAPGAIEAGAWMESFALDRTYRGSTRIEEGHDREGRVTRAALFLRLGLPARSALLVEWPYEIRSRDQTFATGGGSTDLDFDNRAPGDLSTLLLVTVWPRTGVSPWGVDAGAGLKWATGSVDREDDGRFLPVELQSGTGSADPLFALAARRAWPAASVRAVSVVRVATTGRNGYRFGSEWTVAAAVTASLHPDLAPGLDARFRSAGRDRFAGRIPPNTGGRRLLAGPRLTAAVRPLRLSAYGAFLVPVWQDLNGVQLGVGRQLLFGVSWPAP